MDLLIVFECEHCYSLLDTLTAPHNCPCEEAPYFLRQPPLPHFRAFLDSFSNSRLFVIRGQRELNYLLEFFSFALFFLLKERLQ